MYIRYFIIVLFIFFNFRSFAQLDNSKFQFLSTSDSSLQDSSLYFSISNTNYLKNNEYFGAIADGFTLFGYQATPYLTYQYSDYLSLSLGAFAQKVFGENGFDKIQPIYQLKYQKNKFKFNFGTLDGSLQHQLIEPLYNFERLIKNRIESGLQFKYKSKFASHDLWIDWQDAIVPGSNKKEKLWGGYSSNYNILNKENFSISMPVQATVYHNGGQIDTSTKPTFVLLTGTVGLKVAYINTSNSFLNKVELSTYAISSRITGKAPFSQEKGGNALYYNILVKNKVVDLLVSYYHSNSYDNPIGGDLYQSQSNVFRTLSQSINEPDRKLLIIRFLKDWKISNAFSISARVEPYYDVNQNLWEYSYGFFTNFNTDFLIKKFKK